jgi:hypothetical protein
MGTLVLGFGKPEPRTKSCFFFFFYMSTQGEGIQINDIRFMRRGLQPIKLPFGDLFKRYYFMNIVI